MRPHFRFEDLEIWQISRRLAVKFHELAAQLDQRKLYRYAEQLRGAGLSLSNNIAEGSGSIHPLEFKRFLNIARNSAFEDASMLMVFETMGLVVAPLLKECDLLSRKITNFSRTLMAPKAPAKSEGVRGKGRSGENPKATQGGKSKGVSGRRSRQGRRGKAPTEGGSSLLRLPFLFALSSSPSALRSPLSTLPSWRSALRSTGSRLQACGCRAAR